MTKEETAASQGQCQVKPVSQAAELSNCNKYSEWDKLYVVMEAWRFEKLPFDWESGGDWWLV